MSSRIGQSNPQLLINNIAISFIPNSLKLDLGLGEQNVKAVAGGAGAVETVYFEDAESNVSKVSFEMYTTELAFISHTDWKALGNANVIEYIGKDGVSVHFQFMAQTNRTEFEIGNDKMVSFEFMGDPAIIG